MPDQVHPAVAKILDIETRHRALEREWAEAVLDLHRLVGTGAQLGRLLLVSKQTGNKRVAKARRILEQPVEPNAPRDRTTWKS